MLKSILPHDSKARKGIPLATGLLDYFPAALAEVAKVSVAGNVKHNPGKPLHWAREKSGDHADCIMRHLVDRGTTDPETGARASAEVAWRALALLQEEMEAEGSPPGRASRFPVPVQPAQPKLWRLYSRREGKSDLLARSVERDEETGVHEWVKALVRPRRRDWLDRALDWLLSR